VQQTPALPALGILTWNDVRL